MRKKNLNSSVLIVLLSLLTLASCSKQDGAQYVSSSQLSGTDNGNGMDIPGAPNTPNKIGIVTFDQILSSMASLAGITPSAATLSFADVNRSSFSLNGKASEITSGMWMSIT